MKQPLATCTLLLVVRRGLGAMPPTVNYCKSNGGSLEGRHTQNGDEYGLCVFDDGSACADWWYYRGECDKGSTPVFSAFCEESGGELTREDVDWGDTIGASPADYEMCTFENGTECDEYSYYVGACATYRTKVWR